MSILIKGMEMPCCCDECRFLDEYGDYPCCIITDEQRGYNFPIREKRMDKCPLIEIPPHGRLIDADEAIGHLFNGEQCLYSWDEIEGAIDATETIIPAEEGET